jgi:hypothetical protein
VHSSITVVAAHKVLYLRVTAFHSMTAEELPWTVEEVCANKTEFLDEK